VVTLSEPSTMAMTAPQGTKEDLDKLEGDASISTQGGGGTASGSSPHGTPPESNTFQIHAASAASIKRSRPDATNIGLASLRVKGDEDISFLRFDLSSVSKWDTVSKAMLRLSLQSLDDNVTVAVDALPHAGVWLQKSISWNNPVETKDSSRVSSLPVNSKNIGKFVEFDVTLAIDPKQSWVSFQISSDTTDYLTFGSPGTLDGQVAPELVLTLSAPSAESMTAPQPTKEDFGEVGDEPSIPTQDDSDPPLSNAPETSPDPDTIEIKADSVATINKSHPTHTNVSMAYLSVKDGMDVSLLRFDLSSLSKGDKVSKAILRLFLHRVDANQTVAVDVLPHADKLLQSPISWNKPVDIKDSSHVNLLSISLSNLGEFVEVDVTSAMDPNNNWVTFQLSGSKDYVNFGSPGYLDEKMAPELVVTLSDQSTEGMTAPQPTKEDDQESNIVTQDEGDTTDSSLPGVSSSNAPETVEIKAATLATIMKSHPTPFETSELAYLSARVGQRTSFIKFDLSFLWKEAKVEEAFLRLYAKTVDSHAIAAIDVLPHAGDWSEESVSWNDPLETKDLSHVNTLSIATTDEEDFVEVDVTSAIDSTHSWVTFQLSTDSTDTLKFARAFRAPELVVTLSEAPAEDTTAPLPNKEDDAEFDGEPNIVTQDEGDEDLGMATVDSSSPEVSVPNPPGTSVKSDEFEMEASSVATIMKSHPSTELAYLSVKSEHRTSFVKFDLSSLWKDGKVEEAVFWLYLARVESDADVAIDILPHAGDWSEESVSWENPINTKDLFSVNIVSFKTSDEEEWVGVDVTPSIEPSYDWVTFQLSTESTDILKFARSARAPELVVTMSSN